MLRILKKNIFIFFLTIAFIPTSYSQLSILLVNDNDRTGEGNLIDSISGSLDRLNYEYTIYDAITEGTAPPSSTMMQYDMCIWYCGRDGVDLNFWTVNGQRNIKIFLDHGGMLWTMGRDIFYDKYGSNGTPPVASFVSGDFAYDYLGLSEYYGQSFRNDNNSICSQIDLVAGHSISSIDPIEWNDPSDDGKYVGAFTPTASATAVYELGPLGYALEGYYCSVYNEYHTGKTITSEFSVSQIDSRANRDQYIDETLDYFFSEKEDLFQILLYNDNNNTANHIDKVKTAISNAGYYYQYFNDYGFSSSPQDVFMQHFDLVIWVTGNDGLALNFWNGTDTDNTEIESYIDGGGNFWLLGRDFLYDRYGLAGPDLFSSGSFVYDYLGMQEYHAQTHTDDGGEGVEQLDASTNNDIFTFTPIDWTVTSLWYVDAVVPTATARKIYEMGPATYVYDGYAAAVYNEKGNGKVLSFTFDPHYINLQSDADTIFAQGIRYFYNENKLILSELAYSQDDDNSKFIEIYNTGSNDVDLSSQDWYVCYQDAETGNFVDIQLSGGTISAGDSWVITKSAADFQVSFGYAADQENSSLNINGDDPVFLYMAGDHSNGILKDKFGLKNIDGSGSDWEYTDAHAVRTRNYQYPKAVFDINEWDIRTASTLEMTPGQHRAEITFNGTSSNSWSQRSNWDLSTLPDISFNVNISSSKTSTLSTTGICYDVNIAAGGSLELSGSLDVYGDINNSAGNSGLVIQSTQTTQGSLIHNNSGVNATVERYITGYTADNNGWHLLSSPVNNMAISSSNFLPVSGIDDLYYWDENDSTLGMWINYFDTGFTYFINGKGYLCAYKNTDIKSFTGELNVADIPWSNFSADIDRWHMLGNPFACALDWREGDWNKTDVSMAEIYDEAKGNYYPLDDPEMVTPYIIPSTQGFFVQVADATNTITIPAAARVHNAQDWYKNKKTPDWEDLIIYLKSDNANYQDHTTLRFSDNASMNYEIERDSHKIFGSSDAPQISSLFDNDHFCLNYIPKSINHDSIPLNLYFPEEANYEISYQSTNPKLTHLFLEDKLSNTTINLLNSPIYRFHSLQGSAPSRFVLHFSAPDNINEIEESPIKIYSSANHIFIQSSSELDGKFELFSLDGKLVFENRISGGLFYSQNLPHLTGLYIARFTNNTEKLSIKLIF